MSDVYITLHPKVQFDHMEIALKKMANVIADDETSQKMQQLILDVSAFAHTQRLSQADIESLIVRKLPELKGRIEWGGALAIVMEQQKRKYALDDGITQARLWLEQSMAARLNHPVEYRLLSKIEPIDLPPGKIDLQPMMDQVRFIGNRAELPLYIYVDQVLVTKRQMKFGLLNNADAKNPIMTTGEQEQAVMKGNLDDGREKRNDWMVNKDQQVKVLIQHGPIQIETEGRVQSDANKGDTVMVKRLDSPDVFRAHVLEPGIVMVKE